jgi:hypothetical protein
LGLSLMERAEDRCRMTFNGGHASPASHCRVVDFR